MEDVNEDEHDARRSKPEEVTIHLVTCFLQHKRNLSGEVDYAVLAGKRPKRGGRMDERSDI